MKGQKGITLIALVITIIVMLILAAVSITMAVNGGLFNYARNAKTETETARNAEMHLGDGFVNVDGQGDQSIGTLVNTYRATN